MPAVCLFGLAPGTLLWYCYTRVQCSGLLADMGTRASLCFPQVLYLGTGDVKKLKSTKKLFHLSPFSALLPPCEVCVYWSLQFNLTERIVICHGFEYRYSPDRTG